VSYSLNIRQHLQAHELECYGAGCYLLHFSSPVRGTSHLISWARNIGAAIRQHREGLSQISRLAKRHDVTFQVVCIWPGTGASFVDRLKARHETPRLCHVCGVFADTVSAPNISRRDAARQAASGKRQAETRASRLEG
jgi:hypothetical protein